MNWAEMATKPSESNSNRNDDLLALAVVSTNLLHIGYEPDKVRITVTDYGRAPTSDLPTGGFGSVDIRGRVDAFDDRHTHSAQPCGEFFVEANLPLGETL